MRPSPALAVLAFAVLALASPAGAYSILNALDPRHPSPVPGVPVLPFVGAVDYSD